MTTQPTPPGEPRRAVEDEWGRPTYLQEEPEPRQSAPYAVLVLLVLASFVLCAAGFQVVRVLLPEILAYAAIMVELR